MVIDILQAKEYLWRARASINLVEMADYMDKAKTALAARTGNPNWLYHLPDTDFDLIKHDIQKNIEVALNISASEPFGAYGYQRAVDNVQEVCVELNSHLDAAITWCTDRLISTLLLNAVAWTVLIALIVYLLVANRRRLVDYLRRMKTRYPKLG